MKLVTLMENTACRDDLTAEHGLSLYIEAAGRRILFDAGQSDAFIGNAEQLGVDLSGVDLCILSHGHYDHGGGLAAFLAVNDHAPVYLSRHAFEPHYNGSSKYIGLDGELARSDRLVFTSGDLALGEGLSLHSCRGRSLVAPIVPYGLTMLENGNLQPEDFRHEQYLLIREDERRILVSGCSHRGILNIAAWFRPDVLIGGFHLMKLDPVADRIKLIAAASMLSQKDTVYYTGHCTGEAQFAFLKERLGDRLQALSTGSTFTI